MCGSNGTCFCSANYTGKYCEKVACKTCQAIEHCPNKCNNVGTCDKDGKCACNVGFKGDDCSVKIVPQTNATATTTFLETKEVPMHRLVMSNDRRVNCRSGCNEIHSMDDSERWYCMSNCVEKTNDPRIMKIAPQLLTGQ
jgi:hypothetical protein